MYPEIFNSLPFSVHGYIWLPAIFLQEFGSNGFQFLVKTHVGIPRTGSRSKRAKGGRERGDFSFCIKNQDSINNVSRRFLGWRQGWPHVYNPDFCGSKNPVDPFVSTCTEETQIGEKKSGGFSTDSARFFKGGRSLVSSICYCWFWW